MKKKKYLVLVFLLILACITKVFCCTWSTHDDKGYILNEPLVYPENECPHYKEYHWCDNHGTKPSDEDHDDPPEDTCSICGKKESECSCPTCDVCNEKLRPGETHALCPNKKHHADNCSCCPVCNDPNCKKGICSSGQHHADDECECPKVSATTTIVGEDEAVTADDDASQAQIDLNGEAGEAGDNEGEGTKATGVAGANETTSQEAIKGNTTTYNGTAEQDPILIASGQYLYQEEDFSFSILGNTYSFERYYNSGKDTSDILGKDWFFTIDTRIIHGIRGGYDTEYNTIKILYNETAELLSKAQDNYKFIEDYYEREIDNCVCKIQDFNDSISELSKYPKNEKAQEMIEILKVSIPYYETRKTNLEAQRDPDLFSAQQQVQRIESNLSNLSAQLQEAENLLNHAKSNNTLNQYAVKGTGFADNIECGNDVLLLFDETGNCYTYRILATPVYNNGTQFYPNGSSTQNMIPGDYSRVTLNADGTVTWRRTDNQIWTYGTDGFISRMEGLNGYGIDFDYQNHRLSSISYTFDGLKTILYTFTYNTDGQLSLIQNARDVSETMRYEYLNGRLAKTIDIDNDEISFDYSTDNRLSLITKPDGKTVQIKYEALVNNELWANITINENGYSQEMVFASEGKNGWGLTTTYNENRQQTLFYYDKDLKKTVQEEHPDGTVITYEYDNNGNIVQEIYTNGSFSNKTTYTYDTWGNKKSASYSDGSSEIWEYDQNLNLLKKYTDRDGVTVTYDYNADGTVQRILKGSDVIFQGIYEKGLLKSSTDGLGITTEYTYYPDGNVSTRKTGSGTSAITEKFEYDGRNRITKYTDGENRVTSYVYTDKTVTETAFNGLVTVYSYNSRKDLVQVKQTDKQTGITRITNYEYDGSHNLRFITNPDVLDVNGNVIKLVEYRYDDAGNVTQTIYNDGIDSWNIFNCYNRITGELEAIEQWKAGFADYYRENYKYSHSQSGLSTNISTLQNRVTEYGYDRWNRMTSVTNALGETTTTGLTAAGRTSTVQSAYGGEYSYTWTTDGNLLSAGETGATEKVTYTYYDSGDIKTVTDRLGNVTEYFYDTLGNLERTVSPERIVWYTYDKAGRVTGEYVTDTNVNSIFSTSSSYGRTSGTTTLNTNVIDSYVTYAYSSDGRTVTVTSGGTYKATIKLNAFGETVSQTDGEGNSVTYEYDALGRAVKSIDGYGKATVYEYNALGSVSKVTYRDGTNVSYVYDHMGNVTEITDAEGTAAQYTYDSVGRLIKSETRGNPVVEYAYDVLDRVTEVKTAGVVTEKYAYTTRGRLVTAIDAQGKSYSYEYDEFGRLVKENNRLEDSSSYTYDAEGNIETAKDFEGNVTSYSYDAPSRTKTTYYADGTSVIYEYTPSGNIKSVTGATGTITYTYNKAGLLTSQNDIGAGEVTYYSYDRAGNRTKAESDSRTIQYSYGKNGETLSVYDSTNGTKVQLTYDSMGRETKRTYANGNEQVTTYDSLGRKVAIKQTDKRGNTIFAEAYVYKDGRRIATIDKDCNVTYYEYNDFGELSQVLYPYSESLEEEARQEALEAGLVPGFACIEWKNQTADEQILLKAAYLKIADIVSGYGWYGHYQPTTVNVPATERVWKESYTYDLNGNRETKTTAFGTIYYTYDDENRLRFSGRDRLVNLDEEIGGRTTNWDELTQTEWYAATDETNYTTNSLKGTRFTYDKNGNMLSSENLYSVKFFDYDTTNRMALSTVTDLIDHTYTATTYAYDALGRRTLTQTEGHTAERTLYDGMSFEVLRQGTADSNGRFVSTDVAKGRFSYGFGFPFTSYTTYNSTGNWLLDLFFGGMWGFGAGAHGSNQGKEAEPEYYDIENLYPLYANGEAAATYEEDLVYSPHETFWNNWGGFYSGLFGTRESYYSTYSETNYFATDLLGSVKVTTNARGEVSGKTSYDVFGSLYGSNGTLAEDRLLFAYTGKTWNDITELSNYGFRDYAPQIARFTTVDPIRDGSNWYAYVHNDPIDHVDLWGLWTNNNDGTFTAQKGDTLYGLQQETGRNWESFDYEGKPELLQIGQTVSVTKQEKATTNITIDSTIEAVKHYYNGNGESVNLGDKTIQALMDSPEQEYNRNALANGTAKSTTQRYGVDLTSSTYHVGDTVVTYEKSEGTKYRVVTYSAFVDDGFWDVLPGDGDGIGPKKELPGGTPYSYVPYTWTEVYEKEETCNND